MNLNKTAFTSNHNHIIKISISLLAFLLILVSCSKDKVDNSLPSINGFMTSDEVSSSNLIVKCAFENSSNDTFKTLKNPFDSGVSYVVGKKGFCWSSNGNAYTLYNSVSDSLSNLHEFTICFWLQNQQKTNESQSVFQLLNDSNWIGNLFLIQDNGNGGNDSFAFQLGLDKWDALVRKEQWMPFQNENRLLLTSNKWNHIAFRYDKLTSKINTFVNGRKLNIPDSIMTCWQDDPNNGGKLWGPLYFKNAKRFVFGRFKQQLPGSFQKPDSWMGMFNGKLDEFRIYQKALSDYEIEAIFGLENVNR